ncbi:MULTISPECIES: hypothetical protein [Pseudomonas]|uniref:hypothetical protein n=1 Tax=Pseudomonas TaxID=286 RepID=UPI002E7B3D7F|nr:MULTISPECIES: hypothetical protein [unclassified Pseudomonas]
MTDVIPERSEKEEVSLRRSGGRDRFGCYVAENLASIEIFPDDHINSATDAELLFDIRSI